MLNGYRVICATRRALLIALACGMAATASAQSRLSAQERAFPTRPVRLIVPLPPGGAVDIMARLLSTRLTERWRHPVVVDNRPGASGMIGTEIVSRAPPDGYTLAVIAITHITAPLVYKRHSYDPIGGFAPVVAISEQPFLLLVNPALPVTNVRELIAYAKSRSPTLNYTSSDTGSASHLSGELFKHMAGIEMTHIPYRASMPALTDTAAGNVPVIFVSSLPALLFIKSGRLRPLAATGGKRIPSLPDLPTVDESGLPGFFTTTWNGMLAPAGTPRRIVLALNEAVTTILRTPELRDRFLSDGTELIAGSPEAFHAMLVAEQKRWADVVKAVKIEVY